MLARAILWLFAVLLLVDQLRETAVPLAIAP
jgi:hypothetical protein